MQISGREHQPLEITEKSVLAPQIKNRGPCPVCKQYLPQLKLGPFIKHRHHCKGDLRDREVSCSPPVRYINSYPSIKEHPCQICGKTFERANTLKSHLLLHTSEKRFQCSDCGKCFARKDSLNKHLTVHTGVKSFRCGYCGKYFGYKNSLELHQRKHTGYGLHDCSQCDKRFALRRELVIHMRTHTGEKPYECKHCNKTFSQRSNLRTHQQRIHMGERKSCSQI